MKLGFALLSLICLSSFACNQTKSSTPTETKSMGSGKVTVIVPTAVWKAVESEFALKNVVTAAEGESSEGGKKKEETKKESSGKEGSESDGGKKPEIREGGHSLKVDKNELDELLKKHPQTENFSFQVQVLEKTDGVLGGKNYVLDFPPGGGILDLSYYISESTRGSFYLKFNWDKKEFLPGMTKVYFVSRSKIREVEGMKLGSGCGHFFDLTSYWQKNMDVEGFFLNTTHDRHLSVLVGNYYFFVIKDGKIFESSIEILDSRHRDLMCVAN